MSVPKINDNLYVGASEYILNDSVFVVCSGKNENGHWKKYSDGTLLQWFYKYLGSRTFTAYSSAYPGLYTDHDYGGYYYWTFPIPFRNNDVAVTCTPHSSAYMMTSASSPSANGCSFNYNSVYGFTTGLGLSLFAIGEWKIHNYWEDGDTLTGNKDKIFTLTQSLPSGTYILSYKNLTCSVATPNVLFQFRDNSNALAYVYCPLGSSHVRFTISQTATKARLYQGADYSYSGTVNMSEIMIVKCA